MVFLEALLAGVLSLSPAVAPKPAKTASGVQGAESGTRPPATFRQALGEYDPANLLKEYRAPGRVVLDALVKGKGALADTRLKADERLGRFYSLNATLDLAYDALALGPFTVSEKALIDGDLERILSPGGTGANQGFVYYVTPPGFSPSTAEELPKAKFYFVGDEVVGVSLGDQKPVPVKKFLADLDRSPAKDSLVASITLMYGGDGLRRLAAEAVKHKRK